MARTKSKEKASDDEFFESIMGLGVAFLATYGLFRMINRDQLSPEQRRIQEMEQEIARMYPGRDGW